MSQGHCARFRPRTGNQPSLGSHHLVHGEEVGEVIIRSGPPPASPQTLVPWKESLVGSLGRRVKPFLTSCCVGHFPVRMFALCKEGGPWLPHMDPMEALTGLLGDQGGGSQCVEGEWGSLMRMLGCLGGMRGSPPPCCSPMLWNMASFFMASGRYKKP